MADIGLSVSDINVILNSVLSQAKLAPATVVDTSSFISVAQTALKTAPEQTLQALGQVLSQRSIVSIRPYERKFKNLERSEEAWGNAVRKISYADTGFIENEEYKLEDGTSVDMYKVMKPNILQTNFYGQTTYSQGWTMFSRQLDVAFSNPQDFARFVGGIIQNKADEREQAHESLARATLTNLIGGVIAGSTTGYVRVLTLYNTEKGTSLTATDVFRPENFPGFLKFFVATLKIYMKLMSERSKLFQVQVTGKEITRHTPSTRARMYMYSPFIEKARTEVLADVFHDGYLKEENMEEVNYWQSINEADRMSIKVTAGYMDDTGAYKSKAVTNTKVLACLFDEDAAGYTTIHQTGGSTPYNPKGGYTNTFVNFNDRYYNDFTEKAIVFTLE